MKLARAIEFSLLYIGVPVLLIYTEDIFPLIPTILVILLGVIITLRCTGWQYRDLWVIAPRTSWRNMFLVWLFSAVFWTIVVSLWQPEQLFAFPTTAPQIWVMVMLLYPIVSALPQEILYRTFFWHRYGMLFNHQKWVLIVVSGVMFMWAHLLFMNAFALFITLIGGLTFAWRYHHTRSLPLVAVEHALYGNLFFTLGLGQFLFSGAV